MEATSSLTQGCFLFNAASFKRQTSILPGTFQSLPGETVSDASKRADIYHKNWTSAKQIIEEITANQHDELFTSLVKFVGEASEQLRGLSASSSAAGDDKEEEGEGSEGASVPLPPRLEIPTAVMVAGVNMPDHAVLFRQLRSKIVAWVTPHVAQLQADACSSGMKALWKEILLQLTETELSDVETEEEGGGETSKPNLSLPSLSLLQTWYRTTHQSKAGPPVVVIVEDFEGFSTHILQNLIMSISPHLGTLPVVLILGVATSGAAIHSLPRSSSSLLCVEQFAAPSAIDTLTHLIQKVLLSPALPFNLGHQALQFLLHQYLCNSLSISQFSCALQMSMLEHFHWQPLSFLIGQWDDLNSLVAGLNHNQCEMVRATPSFRKYIEGLSDPVDQIILLTKDKNLKEIATEQLQRLRVHQQTFPPLLFSLHTLTEGLPTAPLGRKLHDVLLMCMERHIVEHSKFDTAWNLLKMMSREGLAPAVEESVAILNASLQQDRDNSTLVKTLQVLKCFLAKLERIDREARQAAEEREEEVGTAPRELLTTSERKMMFHERLRQMASRKREPSAFEKARATLLHELLPCLQEGLIPSHMLPLHEVCYFNNASSLRKHLSPAPRASLHIALTKPTFYLPSATSVSEHSRLSPNMPDLCIVYQLHLECGRLINLFDWLCSFVSVVDPAATEKLTNQEGGRGRKEDINPTLQARFIQAVSELQLLGFVKPTQRKTDHVQRLTWGAC